MLDVGWHGVQMQLRVLESIGEQLMRDTGSQCNIYGGVGSCVALPSDSAFAALCPDHPLMVRPYSDEKEANRN
jgi:hypothetical protein